ncbi:MAG: CubicO group peptidase (beta-lactamase class C family) [Rhodothermales bacterium]|jgi:CubicO group peptidase (beta-lactamase class C family)
MKRRVLLTIAVTFLLVGGSSAQVDEMRQTLQSYYDAGLFNGSVLVAKGDQVLIAEGYGMADRRWSIPNDANTRFRIGSVTKQFTSTIILQLVEEGELSLDQTLSSILPDYPAAQGDAVTLHQLLNHTSGIPSYTSIRGFFQNEAYHPLAIDSLARLTAWQDLEFEPGSDWSYNNTGYVILGLIVERKTEMTFEEALHARILEPLGMENTGYDNYATVTENMASGYERSVDGDRNAAYLDTSIPHAAGMMFSTVGDLRIWARALAAAAPFRDVETLAAMWTPGLQDYAYGIAVSEMELGGESRRVVQHSGGINGFSAFLRLFPDDDLVFATLDNISGGSGSVTQALTRAYFTGEAQIAAEPVSRAMFSAIEEHGVEDALSWYREAKEAGASYQFGERELNTVAYIYLGQGDVETAIAIFELNVREYPEASNPYDSLGEAYEAAGVTARAIESYRKSLDLDEGNQHARDRLAALGSPATDGRQP